MISAIRVGRPAVLATTCIAFATTGIANGQWSNGYKVTASDGDGQHYFGTSVSASQGFAMIGAPDNGPGATYVFEHDGSEWTEVQQLRPTSITDDDDFGCGVTVSGNRAAIGAARDGAGALYLYTFSDGTWNEERKVTASDGQPDDRFGFSVAMTDEVLIAGAYSNGGAGTNAGAAYVFRRVGGHWVEAQKLTAPGARPSDFFGYAVALSGDVAVIGAYGDDSNGSQGGAAYVFRDNGSSFVFEQKLLASDGESADLFSWSLAVSGDVIVVGAHGADVWGGSSGAAYVFGYDGSSWAEEARLVPPDGGELHRYGSSVGVSGNVVVVGAKTYGSTWYRPGAAYAYRFVGGEWTLERMVLAPDAAHNDLYGNAVAVAGDTVVIGAMSEAEDGLNAGAAYFFEGSSVDADGDGVVDAWDNCPNHANPDQADCDGDGIGDVCTIAEGMSDDCNLNGTPDDCEIVTRIEEFSGAMSPIGLNSPQSHVIAAAPEALDDVRLSFEVSGDFSIPQQYVDVDINGVFVGRLLENDGTSCPIAPDQAELVVPMAVFNDALGGAADAVITMTTSFYVNPGACSGDNFIAVSVDYAAPSTADMDGNGVLDECEGGGGTDSDNDGVLDVDDNCPSHPNPDQADCDGDGIGDVCAIAEGASEDCNANGVPDSCDIDDGTSEDADGNGTPDECEPCPDVDGDGEVGFSDILRILTMWGSCSGCPEDVDRNGVVDFGDVHVALARWGQCS